MRNHRFGSLHYSADCTVDAPLFRRISHNLKSIRQAWEPMLASIGLHLRAYHHGEHKRTKLIASRPEPTSVYLFVSG